MSRRVSPSFYMMAIFFAAWLLLKGRCSTVPPSVTDGEEDLYTKVEHHLIKYRKIVDQNWKTANAVFVPDPQRNEQVMAQGAIIKATWDAYECLTDHLVQIYMHYSLDKFHRVLELGGLVAMSKLTSVGITRSTLSSSHHLDYFTKYLKAFAGLSEAPEGLRSSFAPSESLPSLYQRQAYLQLRMRLYKLALFPSSFEAFRKYLRKSREEGSKEKTPAELEDKETTQNLAWSILLDSFLDDSHALLADLDILIRTAPDELNLENYQLIYSVLFELNPSQLILALQEPQAAPHNPLVLKPLGTLTDSMAQLLKACIAFLLRCDIYRAKVLAPLLLNKLQRNCNPPGSTRPTLGLHDGHFIPEFFGLKTQYENANLRDAFSRSVEFPKNDANAFAIFRDDLQDITKAFQNVAEATYILEMERSLVEALKVASQHNPQIACQMHSECFHLLILGELIRANPTLLLRAPSPSYAPHHNVAFQLCPQDNQLWGRFPREYLQMPSRPTRFYNHPEN